MQKQLWALAAFVVLLTACSKNEKKIMVLNKGKANIDVSGKKVVLKNGGGNEDHEMYYNTADKVSIEVTGDDKTVTIDIPENGYYILNAKNDTIIGSYQSYSEAGKQNVSDVYITQEMIQKSIDSLVALTEGKNISAANRNFYILPYTAVKVTNNANAIIIAPFHNMRSIEKEGDVEPEVYRFYSIKEIREKIDKQKALTSNEKK